MLSFSAISCVAIVCGGFVSHPSPPRQATLVPLAPPVPRSPGLGVAFVPVAFCCTCLSSSSLSRFHIPFLPSRSFAPSAPPSFSFHLHPFPFISHPSPPSRAFPVPPHPFSLPLSLFLPLSLLRGSPLSSHLRLLSVDSSPVSSPVSSPTPLPSPLRHATPDFSDATQLFSTHVRTSCRKKSPV